MRRIGEESVEQHRINRINRLLDRLDRIPVEIDRIHERLMKPATLTRKEYADLVSLRDNLDSEYGRVENELKRVYKMKL